MRKLLSANLSRLWKSKAFWLTVFLMAFLEGFFCLIMSGQGAMPRDYVLFICLQGIGIFASIFCSSFLGTEYSDGTIRNKLIVGHKRSSIYLASFLTGSFAVTLIYLSSVLTGAIMGLLLFATPHYGISEILIAGGIGWLASISYTAIFHLVGMLSSNKARTSMICILTAFLLIFVGLIFDWLTRGNPNSTLLFFYELNPFGQTARVMMIHMDSPWRLAAYAMALTASLTGIGIYFFRKKDLK